MRYGAFAIVGVLLSSWSITPPAVAQQTCELLAQNLRQDELIQGSDQRRYQAFQSLIRNDRFRSFGSAQSETVDGSLSVEGYVSGVLGIKSNASNWEQNRALFLTTRMGEVASSASAALLVRQSSEAAYRAIVACESVYANRTGLFSIFSVPTHEAFSIKFVHRASITNGYDIQGFTVVPKDAVHNCDHEVLKTSLSSPLHISTSEFIVQCQKDPDQAVTVTAVTSEGSVGPYTAASVRDELQELKDQTEAEIVAVRKNLAALQQHLLSWPGSDDAYATKEPVGMDPGSTHPNNWDTICPKGSYAVGLRWWGSNNRGDCDGCVNRTQLLCKPLNSE